MAFGFILAFGSGEEQPESELKAGLDPRESNKKQLFIEIEKIIRKAIKNKGDYLPRST